jgi:hypothetical protein
MPGAPPVVHMRPPSRPSASDQPPTDRAGFMALQQKKPELLNFLSDDKWQTVSAWLPREGHVRD